jgi:hypothetical protein
MLADPPTLAVIDGVTEALALHGLDLGKNPDVASWLALLPRRLMAMGTSVVQLDHVTKDKEARGRYAIGAQHKMAGVDVAYRLDVVEPFGRGLDGRSRLIVTKDRPGFIRAFAERRKWAADVVLRSSDGDVELALCAPSERGAFRPTYLMEQISKAVEKSPGMTKNGIRGLPGNNSAKDLGLELLVVEQYLRVETKGQAHHHHSVRPYREAEDEGAS